ncbi:hypothetical protein [Lentzea jiangxiensis]|uniref:hypothetical protein n=1 Tax=Lentzea jiangxiensis TaxID=641025 RepID=UPI00115F87C3|nr:hypothetical protein [Lentzea jiangxiensis]
MRRTEREKSVEIFALRPVVLVLLAWAGLRRFRLLISLDAVLRWHRDLVKRRHARASVNRRPGRPRTVASSRQFALRPRGVVGASTSSSRALGVAITASTVEDSPGYGCQSGPRQPAVIRVDFPRSQDEAILAMGFVEIVALTGQRQHILATIHHADKRVRALGTTAHPVHAWAFRPSAPCS